MKRIEGTDYYFITKDGRIFSNARGEELVEMKQQLGLWNYYSICLRMPTGEDKKFLTHRLVAQAYVPNPEKLRYVNHIDGNKLNNHSDNLEWCTSSDNQKHAYATGLKEKPEGVKNGRNRLSEEQVLEIYWALYNGARNVDLKKKYGVGTGTLTGIKSKSSWQHLLSDLPEIPIRSKRSRLSESTVRWICERYQEGKTPTQVLKMSTNPAISIHQLEDIKRRRGFKDIVKDYQW